MLRKEFEIWKVERERAYTDELLELQNDLANRGLTFSGIRTQAEERLKQKCDTDIQTTRLRMEENENLRKSWFPGGNWRPFTLSSIVSIIVGFIVYLLTKLTQ